jgi:ketosteroid isomerase-like protein
MHAARRSRLALLLAPLFACPVAQAATPAAIPEGDALVRTVNELDRKVFDAYNNCDLKTFGDYFSADVEFFHDKGGLMTGRDAVVDATRRNICHKVRRELVGTLQVYPIKDYGAIETGTHRFCQIGSNACQGEGKFLHIWRYGDGRWQLVRVVSYDHHSIEGGGK